LTYTCHAFGSWKTAAAAVRTKRCLSALNADIRNAIETEFLRGRKTDAAKKRFVENAQPLMFLRGATLPILNTGLLKFKTNLWIQGIIF